MFKHANDPKHAATAVKAYLDRKTCHGLSRTRTSTLPKQCGIVLTKNRTKRSQTPKKSFEMSF